MFRSFVWYIGYRYTRAKKRNQFVSFISLMSMIGIGLGVMVLVTVLSVMNGFDQQIREKIFVLVPHITITSPNGKIDDWQSLLKQMQQNPQVTAAVPIINGQALLSNDGTTVPAVVSGILPKLANEEFSKEMQIEQGSITDLNSTPFGIVLGEGLAANLGVVIGDKVNLITPNAVVTPIGVIPRFKQFKVVGIFHAGSGFGFDNSYAFIALPDAQKLFMLGNGVNQIQIRVKDLFSAPAIATQMQQSFSDRYDASDWTEQYGAFYHAVKMEKTIMFFILLLLIAIAAFNLVSSLMMGVNDKEADIAILRTFGATPKMIMKIFIIQGSIIGLIGTLFGIIAGVLLSLNITALVNCIEAFFHVQLISSDVYFVDFLPSKIQVGDIITVALCAFLMSLVATLYPAWRASKIQPAEALRYE